MGNNIYRKIYTAIKKYDTIVIARHVGPDPDALGSTIGLKEIIKKTFPNKKVFAVGCSAAKFKYLGILDKFTEDMYQNSLLIVTDTPDKGRVDSVDPAKFSFSIKIDHHPFIEKYCDIEWIDETSSSASQMIMELTFNSKLEITKNAAEKLYVGLVADTDRFLFSYTTPRTFDLVSRLIKETKLDFTELYKNLYIRPFREIRFQGYLQDNLQVTKHGFGYIKITEDILEKYNVDAATAGNMVNNFGFIDEILSWAIFSEDRNNNIIRGSIRSRGPIINETASHFGGGGHIFASGVRLKTFDDCDMLIEELDDICRTYRDKE